MKRTIQVGLLQTGREFTTLLTNRKGTVICNNIQLRVAVVMSPINPKSLAGEAKDLHPNVLVAAL